MMHIWEVVSKVCLSSVEILLELEGQGVMHFLLLFLRSEALRPSRRSKALATPNQHRHQHLEQVRRACTGSEPKPLITC